MDDSYINLKVKNKSKKVSVINSSDIEYVKILSLIKKYYMCLRILFENAFL
jgi:hypothetical protein